MLGYNRFIFEFNVDSVRTLILGVCYLRLDFENFDINGLSASTEVDDSAGAGNEVILTCQDKFTISVKNAFKSCE